MDYTSYSFTDNYKCLFTAFKEIRYTLYLFYLLLEKGGVAFDNVYVFGHSFGSQVALQASLMLGRRKIGGIDGMRLGNLFLVTFNLICEFNSM